MEESQLEVCKSIADDLERQFGNLDLPLEYIDIVKVSLVAAKAIQKQIPMYVGNLNPKWANYELTIKLLEGRLNGN